MFSCTGIRPARFVSLEKGRAPTLSRHFTAHLPVPPRGRNTLPRGGRRAKLSNVVLADFCLIVSCLAARSAFPYETEKAAALPVVKHIETSSKDLYLLGGHRYWCSETSGRSRKYVSIKNALSHDSGVFHRPWSEPLSICLTVAKVRKNPEPPKKFGKNFHLSLDFFIFYLIFYTEAHEKSPAGNIACRAFAMVCWSIRVPAVPFRFCECPRRCAPAAVREDA